MSAEAVARGARAIGFDAVGICDLRPVERDALDQWLRRGLHGTMSYMQRQRLKRREPARIVDGAKRAVVVVKTYYQGKEGSRKGDGRTSAKVARYAWGEDYHRVVGEKLGTLAQLLVDMGSTPALTRWYVDAGPVPERELAQRAGLGWIAKNTMLIVPTLGSFTFLGTVFTDLALTPSAPFEADRCGSCRLCLDACPTNAILDERMLDATRCISYLTIEYREAFDATQGEQVDDWIFGCDVCQEVCPWNGRFAAVSDEPRFAAHPTIVDVDVRELVDLDAETFQLRYGDTALMRAGPRGLARNARQVVANREQRAQRSAADH